MFRRAYRGYELIISSWILSQPLLAVILSWWAKWLRCNFSDTQTNLESKKRRLFFLKVEWSTFFTSNEWSFCFVLFILQVNIFQKHLFFHQLTHSLTKDCSLNYEFSTWKLQAQNMLCKYINCSECQNKKQFVYTTCSELVVFMYWTRNSMNNLLSNCGLVDGRISASEKDLPVMAWTNSVEIWMNFSSAFWQSPVMIVIMSHFVSSLLNITRRASFSPLNM